MDVFEAINSRYSVRAYSDRPVEEDKVRKVLEAGRRAPSAKNRQQWKFVVVRDAELRRQLGNASCSFVADAPVVIAVVGLTPDSTMFCGIPTDPVDCAIALDHMSLAATALGLGTCWIGHFHQRICSEILGVPDGAKIIELMPLGYPADKYVDRGRKQLEEVVCNDKFA